MAYIQETLVFMFALILIEEGLSQCTDPDDRCKCNDYPKVTRMSVQSTILDVKGEWFQFVSPAAPKKDSGCSGALGICKTDTEIAYCYDKTQFCFNKNSVIPVPSNIDPIITAHDFVSCKSKKAEFYYAWGLFKDSAKYPADYDRFNITITYINTKTQIDARVNFINPLKMKSDPKAESSDQYLMILFGYLKMPLSDALLQEIISDFFGLRKKFHYFHADTKYRDASASIDIAQNLQQSLYNFKST